MNYENSLQKTMFPKGETDIKSNTNELLRIVTISAK